MQSSDLTQTGGKASQSVLTGTDHNHCAPHGSSLPQQQDAVFALNAATTIQTHQQEAMVLRQATGCCSLRKQSATAEAMFESLSAVD